MSVARDLTIEDLRRRAWARTPAIGRVFVDSGTGAEAALPRNRAAFEAVRLTPRLLAGAAAPDPSVELFGRRWAAPIGAAPVGLMSLIRPGAERALARASAAAGLPMTLSTVACEDPETIGRIFRDRGAEGGWWFQLYAPRDPNLRADVVARAAAAGAGALVVTIDVPASSRRERQARAGVDQPPRVTARTVLDAARHPRWALATLARGLPGAPTMQRYVPAGTIADVSRNVTGMLNQPVTPAILAELRRAWRGPLVVKGVMDPEDARAALAAGADGIWVSNHGGRQLDPVAPALEALPAVVDAVAGRAAILFDSGVRDGADAARALALGADFVMAGRAMIYGVAAGLKDGAARAYDILAEELVNVMAQTGAARPADLRARLAPPPGAAVAVAAPDEAAAPVRALRPPA